MAERVDRDGTIATLEVALEVEDSDEKDVHIRRALQLLYLEEEEVSGHERR